MTTELSTRFLEQVWRLQSAPLGSYTFLAAKDWDSGQWRDIPLDQLDIDTHHTHNLPPNSYFTPNWFTDNRRLRANALPGCWLYADLDEVTPYSLPTELVPTLAWETSPDRYQCMWLLDRLLSPRTLEKLNRRLTYFTGADRGGWSLTKVLRVPGTTSTKYGTDSPFRVRMLPTSKPLRRYLAQDVAALVRDVDTTNADSLRNSNPRPSITKLPSYLTLYKRTRRRMPIRARQLLNTQNVLTSDDRSARLWELEHLLLDARIKPEHVLVLAKHSPWNKYRGQRRELDMLWREIIRAKTQRAGQPVKLKPTQSLRKSQSLRKRRKSTQEKDDGFVSYRDLMTRSLPRSSWLVEGIWSEGAHGLLAGEPKSFKTLITLDLAVSVASGTPFLGRFPVPKQGPVIIIQEENAMGDIQDRLRRITMSRGEGPSLHANGNGGHTIDFGKNLSILVRSNKGFSLVEDEDLRMLERVIVKYEPALVVLDPLYLLAPGIDEDSAVQMTPILKDLLRLKQKHGVGIMIVHHYKKKSKDNVSTRTAERMSGTGVFHRWLASGVYVERPDESLPVVRLTSEHRSQASPGAFSVTFDLGTDEDEHYEATVETWVDKKKRQTTQEDADDVTDLILNYPGRGDRIRVSALARHIDITPKAMLQRLRRREIDTEMYHGSRVVVRSHGAARSASDGRADT